MNLEQALKVALEHENAVRDHYAEGARAITDARGKRVFEVLAREEQGHVDYLEGCLEEWTRTGKVSDTELVPVVAPGLDWVEAARAELKEKPSERVAKVEEIELLNIALKLETKTSAFYRELVATLPAEERKLFDKFLQIEDGHVTIVQAELDSVQGLGVWFDMMEFSLEG